MAHSKFTPNTAHSPSTIATPISYTHLSTNPTHRPKRHWDPISRFATVHFLVRLADTDIQSINQSIKVICNARNVVHKLESEARAVASGRVLLMVIEKVGLEVSFESIYCAWFLDSKWNIVPHCRGSTSESPPAEVGSEVQQYRRSLSCLIYSLIMWAWMSIITIALRSANCYNHKGFLLKMHKSVWRLPAG